MFRFKTVFGDRLQTRRVENQFKELLLKTAILNRMTYLGMPDTIKIAWVKTNSGQWLWIRATKLHWWYIQVWVIRVDQQHMCHTYSIAQMENAK